MHGTADTAAGWMLFGGGLMWLFWILLIVLVVVIVKALVNDGNHSAPPKTAMDILTERYARGEIDKDEFDQKRRELEN